MTILSKSRAIFRKYPVLNGIASHSLIWPTSCLLQQTISGTKLSDLDYTRALHFSIYGGLYMAPILFYWLRWSRQFACGKSYKSVVKRVLMDQCIYGPFALSSFFFMIALLAGKSINEAKNEVQGKFIPSYEVGWCIWPFIHVINQLYIKERNKVHFIGACQFGWTVFLAYMQQEKLNVIKNTEDQKLK